MYVCKHASGTVAVNFKPESELKDLITWAMGFTCKNFILDPRIVSTGKKVTVIAPNKMSASDAYRLFLASLSTMGLSVVPKANALRIGGSASAKSEGGDPTQLATHSRRPSAARTLSFEDGAAGELGGGRDREAAPAAAVPVVAFT